MSSILFVCFDFYFLGLTCMQQVNYLGVVRTTKAFLDLLKRSGCHAGTVPRILNIASMSGLVALPGASAYAASKHAVVGFSKSIRVELAYSSVSVSAICPTFHRTPLLTGLQSKIDRIWELAGADKRAEYGEEAHAELKKGALDLYTGCGWDPRRVTEAIVRACLDPWAPPPVVRVGMDAKYVLGGECVWLCLPCVFVSSLMYVYVYG